MTGAKQLIRAWSWNARKIVRASLAIGEESNGLPRIITSAKKLIRA